MIQRFLLPRYWGVPGSSCTRPSLVPACLCKQRAAVGPSGLYTSERTHGKRGELHWERHKHGWTAWERTHIDDDVVAFIFQSHAELELWVIDEVHVLLQHLQIMGNCGEVHAGTGREAVLLQLMYLNRGAVLLQDVHHSVKADGRPLLGVAQPVLGVEQTVHIKPGLQLGSRAERCENVLLFWNLAKGKGNSKLSLKTSTYAYLNTVTQKFRHTWLNLYFKWA